MSSGPSNFPTKGSTDIPGPKSLLISAKAVMHRGLGLLVGIAWPGKCSKDAGGQKARGSC